MRSLNPHLHRLNTSLLFTPAGNPTPLSVYHGLSVFVTSHKLEKPLKRVVSNEPDYSFLCWVGRACLGYLRHPPAPPPTTGGSAPDCFLQKLQPVKTRGPPPGRLFLERRRALSAGSAVFEGPPVPLISLGTPRRERAPSFGPPHCGVLFLHPCSLHSVKLGGTSSISPVPHVNRRFNQTLLSGPLPPSNPSNPASYTHTCTQEWKEMFWLLHIIYYICLYSYLLTYVYFSNPLSVPIFIMTNIFYLSSASHQIQCFGEEHYMYWKSIKN